MNKWNETHATEPVMISLPTMISLRRLITRTLAALIVISIPGSVVAQAKSPVETSSAKVSDATATNNAPVKGVEERKSSESARAKGEINFDDLKFDLEKDKPFKSGMLNDDVKGLVGQRVKLRGYILPATLFKEKGIGEFVLVRDNQECCFGPGAALFDCVIIEMVPGKTTDFVTRPVTVEGKFNIDVLHGDEALSGTLSDVVNRANVGVIERRRQPRFPDETRPSLSGRTQCDRFESDLAV